MFVNPSLSFDIWKQLQPKISKAKKRKCKSSSLQYKAPDTQMWDLRRVRRSEKAKVFLLTNWVLINLGSLLLTMILTCIGMLLGFEKQYPGKNQCDIWKLDPYAKSRENMDFHTLGLYTFGFHWSEFGNGWYLPQNHRRHLLNFPPGKESNSQVPITAAKTSPYF